jgi:hypothetical protein
MRLYEERFDKEFFFFHAEFLEFQSYSRHRNHFDIDSKRTHSEEIHVIPMERFLDVMCCYPIFDPCFKKISEKSKTSKKKH